MFFIHVLLVLGKLQLQFFYQRVYQRNYLTFHSLKKRKETWAVLLIFSLSLEISGMNVQRIHQNSKKWWLREELLSENDFEAVFATFCYHNYGANASEAEDCFWSKRLSQMLFVRYSLLDTQNTSINNIKKRLITYLLGHLQHSSERCRSCTEKGVITGPWWVSSTMEVR